MAERRPVRERETTVKPSRRPLTAADAGRQGLRQIAQLTGKDPEGVAGVEPSGDGWLVTVDVIEDHRIPSSTDILASYEAELGPDGELVSYGRVRRFARGRGDEAGEVRRGGRAT